MNAPIAPRPAVRPDERLSALVDGELTAADLEQLLADGTECVAAWSCYQLIGDALRGTTATLAPPRTDWVAGVMARVGDEQPLARPAPVMPVAPMVRGRAANDAVFRWKLVAGLASLAAVGVLAWQVVAQPAPGNGAQLAQLPSPQLQLQSPAPAQLEVVVAGEQGPMIRDARLEELMAAHRQLGGMSALQMPAGFLRNATFEIPAR